MIQSYQINARLTLQIIFICVIEYICYRKERKICQVKHPFLTSEDVGRDLPPAMGIFFFWTVGLDLSPEKVLMKRSEKKMHFLK